MVEVHEIKMKINGCVYLLKFYDIFLCVDSSFYCFSFSLTLLWTSEEKIKRSKNVRAVFLRRHNLDFKPNP